MSALSRVKTWSASESLTAAALNAEFNNILNKINGNIQSDNVDLTDAFAWTGTHSFAAAITTTATLTVGVDDTGHDVKFFGATTGKSWLWDESADTMIVTGAATVSEDFTVDTATLHVDSTNNRVGIGTTSPTSILHVLSASNATVLLNAGGNGNVNIIGTPAGTGTHLDIYQGTSDGSDVNDLRIGGGGDVTDTRGAYAYLHGNEHASRPGVLRLSAGNIAGGEIQLYTGGAEVVTVDESGNVGIGATSPDAELDVVGAIAITDGMTAPTNVTGKALIYVDTADGDLKVKFADGHVAVIAADS